MTHICSFDVGIINLAYCIIKTDSSNNFLISGWDTINIDDSIIYCSHEKKKKTMCNKRASVSINLNDLNYYYCLAHKKDGNTLLNNFITEHRALLIENKLIKCNHCKKNAVYKILDILYCMNHYEKIFKLKKMNQTISAKKSIQYLTETMYKKLNNIPELSLAKIILIENQPTMINPTMKTISALLYGYFVMKKMENNIIENVKFISPSNKLKIVNNNKDINNNIDNNNIDNNNIDNRDNKDNIGNKGRKEYILTKTMCIQYCKALLEEANLIESLNKLDKFEKKDDPCDAFLQGYQYLFSGNLKISENIENKLINYLNKNNKKKIKIDL